MSETPKPEESTAVTPVPPPKVEPRRPEAPAPKPVPPPTVVPEPVKPKPPEPEKPPPPAPEKPETPAPTPEKPVEPAPLPKERATVAVMAHVEQVHGEAAVGTDAGRIVAKPGLELLPGHELLTAGRSSYLSIKVTDGTRIELSSDSTLRLISDVTATNGRTFSVGKGVVAAAVAKQPAGQPMLFKTANAEAKVLGTRLVLDVAGESTRLEVREGRVRLTRTEDGAGVDVPAGSFAVASKGAAPAAKTDRASLGLQALYFFREPAGATVHDLSGSGAPLDLRITRPRSTSWTADGLAVTGMTRIDSDVPAAKIIDACRKSNELTVEAWARPAKATVDFDACILSLSTDVQDRNFALVQGDLGAKDLYAASLRTSETNAGGGPHLLTPRGTGESRMAHVVFTRSAAGVEKLYLNGQERASRTRSGTFAGWDAAFRLIAANESTEERPWTGDFRLLAVYSRALLPVEVARNFKAGTE